MTREQLETQIHGLCPRTVLAIIQERIQRDEISIEDGLSLLPVFKRRPETLSNLEYEVTEANQAVIDAEKELEYRRFMLRHALELWDSKKDS